MSQFKSFDPCRKCIVNQLLNCIFSAYTNFLFLWIEMGNFGLIFQLHILNTFSKSENDAKIFWTSVCPVSTAMSAKISTNWHDLWCLARQKQQHNFWCNWTQLFNLNIYSTNFNSIIYVNNLMLLKNCYKFMQILTFVADDCHARFTPIFSRNNDLLLFTELAELLVGVFCIQPHAYNKIIFWQGRCPFFIWNVLGARIF